MVSERTMSGKRGWLHQLYVGRERERVNILVIQIHKLKKNPCYPYFLLISQLGDGNRSWRGGVRCE